MKLWWGIVLMVLAAGALAAEQPAAIVRETSDRLFALIDENRTAYEAEPSRLQKEVRRHLLPHVDTLYSARLVLGRHGRGLSADQVAAFADGLSELLVRRYADGLLEFKNRDQVTILPDQGGNTERMTRVRTKVRLGTGSEAAVDYVFRSKDDRWQVFDVIVEGISYVATFRSQIGEEIRREGFERVLSRLEAGDLQLETDVDDQAA
jgi:phospholipid transport system substrate-binding protein